MSMDAFVFPIPNYNKVYYLFTIWDYLPLSGILFFLKISFELFTKYSYKAITLRLCFCLERLLT